VLSQTSAAQKQHYFDIVKEASPSLLPASSFFL